MTAIFDLPLALTPEHQVHRRSTKSQRKVPQRSMPSVIRRGPCKQMRFARRRHNRAGGPGRGRGAVDRSARMPSCPRQAKPMITATSGSGGKDVPRRLADHGEGPVNTRPDQGASGAVNRWLRPDSVRPMSVITAMQGLTVAHHETRRDTDKKAREAGKTQRTGRFRW
jgi:hypothetical protein